MTDPLSSLTRYIPSHLVLGPTLPFASRRMSSLGISTVIRGLSHYRPRQLLACNCRYPRQAELDAYTALYCIIKRNTLDTQASTRDRVLGLSTGSCSVLRGGVLRRAWERHMDLHDLDLPRYDNGSCTLLRGSTAVSSLEESCQAGENAFRASDPPTSSYSKKVYNWPSFEAYP